jgi:benzoyl-CoA reductase/2-hydroxyglutaryl-CoA dehydratase subunit BcrC/BadD/HgdB
MVPASTLEEQGIILHNREDAIQALVDISLPGEGGNLDPEKYEPAKYFRMIEDWHIDGVVLHMARRCAVLTGGIFQKRIDLQERGIPVGYYEASEADPQEFDERRIRNSFEIFMNILGLNKI